MARQLRHLPGHWAICSSCDGHGGSSAHLGSFTSEDWADQDPDFKEDYLAGAYDRPCPDCDGGRVWIVDVARCTFSQKRELVELRRQQSVRRGLCAEQRAELRACGWEC